MQNNNFDIVKQIQDTADIVQVVSRYIKLIPRGSNYFGLCPFHSDNNPSLVVSKKKKIFKCFVCGAKGNVFSFVQKKEKVSFQEAVMMVAKMINFDTTKIHFGKSSAFDPKFMRIVGANKQAAEWYSGFLKNPENKMAFEYLTKRGLNEETINHFKIGYAGKNRRLMTNMLTNYEEMFGEKNKDLVWNEQELLDAGISTTNKNNEISDFFFERIVFPIYDINSVLVGFSGRTISNNEVKYLNSSSSKAFVKGNILYNLNNIKENNINKLIVVEGFFDAIAFHIAGLKNVVATMGVALTDSHINLLNCIKGLKTIILAFDNDEAGAMATTENGKKLMENGFDVYVVERDKKYKDIDEVLQNEGKEGVINVFENRIDFISFVIKNSFRNKIPKDEINSIVNEIILNMVEFGDVLNRKNNLKLLSKLSNIDLSDLNDKYQQLSKKETSWIKNQTTVLPREKQQIKKEFFGAEGEQLRLQEKIDEVSYNLVKSLDTLIVMMVKYPKEIEKIFDRFTQTRSYGNETQITLMKFINFLYSKGEINKNFLTSKLTEMGEKEKNQKYFDARDYLERLFDDPTWFILRDDLSESVVNERINNLLKKISEYRYSIILLEYQIERAKLINEDREKNKLKIDDLSKKIIDLNDLRKRKAGKR